MSTKYPLPTIRLDFLKDQENIFWLILNGIKMCLLQVLDSSTVLWSQKYLIQNYGKLNITRKVVIHC